MLSISDRQKCSQGVDFLQQELNSRFLALQEQQLATYFPHFHQHPFGNVLPHSLYSPFSREAKLPSPAIAHQHQLRMMSDRKDSPQSSLNLHQPPINTVQKPQLGRKWSAMHVKVAWDIYYKQQAAQTLAKTQMTAEEPKTTVPSQISNFCKLSKTKLIWSPVDDS